MFVKKLVFLKPEVAQHSSARRELPRASLVPQPGLCWPVPGAGVWHFCRVVIKEWWKPFSIVQQSALQHAVTLGFRHSEWPRHCSGGCDASIKWLLLATELLFIVPHCCLWQRTRSASEANASIKIELGIVMIFVIICHVMFVQEKGNTHSN